MIRSARILLLLIALPMFGQHASVSGRVVFDGIPLPGATVTLDRLEQFSDSNGEYRFDRVVPGRHTMTFKLESLIGTEASITATAGENRVPDQVFKIDTVRLSEQNCGDTPESPWGWPACSNYEADTTLIDAMNNGDESAAWRLQIQHDTTYTYWERERIAVALLGHLLDDSTYVDEILEYAENAYRFANATGEPSGEFKAWCDARGYEPNMYAQLARSAFDHVGLDPRGHALLRRALTSSDRTLIYSAVCALGQLHDESALEEIERVIQSQGNDLAWALYAFQSERADALAMRYLKTDEERDQYRLLRNEQHQP